MKTTFLSLLIAVFFSTLYSQKSEQMTEVLIKTTVGDIKIALYNQTPLHRDNFIKLVNKGFYDGLLFHRVIKGFMIQTGAPDSRNADPGATVGMGGPGYTIPAEIKTSLYHKKGALGAARQGDQVNPERRSSGSQFYIVQGEKYSEEQIKQIEINLTYQQKQAFAYKYLQCPENEHLMKKIAELRDKKDIAAMQQFDMDFRRTIDSLYLLTEKPYSFSSQQIKSYTTIGGVPHLDGQYTVFGEVVEGMDVVDKIAAKECDQNNRPKEDIKIVRMEIVKK